MIPVILTLESYDGWAIEGYNRVERMLVVLPRKGEVFKHKGFHYKVREIVHDIDDGSLAPTISIIARAD